MQHSHRPIRGKGIAWALFFVTNPESPYFNSAMFGRVIAYMMKYTRRSLLREPNGRRSMVISDVPNVETAVDVLREMISLTPII